MTNGATTVTTVLTRRALNRATLARQMLLRRDAASAEQAIHHLVGMQAQNPQPPYVGLWTRLEGFRPDELSQLLLDRKVVRIAVMRGTVHLVTADDCLTLRPLVQSIYDRDLATNTMYAAPLRGLDLDAVAAAGRDLLDQQHRTPQELGKLLAERWPESEPSALAHAIRGKVPLVQVPPRGLWGASGRTTYATAESWLGRPVAFDPSPDDMVLRYLAAFGPASVMDAQAWSGLTRLGEVFERLRPRLLTFRDEGGRELFDLPDAPRPDPDTNAPVRFLPEFDNVLMAHADRTRFATEEDRRRLVTPNGVVPGYLFVDGFLRGTWKIARQRGAATLVVRPFRALSKRAASAVTNEGGRLLRFAADDASHDVELVPPD
jgi:Winged helix DNA-binding domain